DEPRGHDRIERAWYEGWRQTVRQEEMEVSFVERTGRRAERPRLGDSPDVLHRGARFRESHGPSAYDRLGDEKKVGIDVDDDGVTRSAQPVEIVREPAPAG